MILKTKLIVGITCGLLFLQTCGGSRPAPPPPVEDFLTLADVSGRTSFTEDINKPEIRIINIRAKSFIKKNNRRNARKTALDIAANKAVDEMVRELLDVETYNNNYQDIEDYLSKNVYKYIEAQEVNNELAIYLDKFWGIHASFKINRQKVQVALQKDLRLINTSIKPLVTVIRRGLNLDLSGIGFDYRNIEDALTEQIEAEFNKRGLRAMNLHNALDSLRNNPAKRAALANISNEQFLNKIAGTRSEDVLLNTQLEKAEKAYDIGLSLLKQLARILVDVNITSVSKKNNNWIMTLRVSAKNIAVATGGTFANTNITVGRQGGPNSIDKGMLNELINDAYKKLEKKFIPQVLKEMSVIQVGGKKLIAYELIMKGFTSRDNKKIRKAVRKIHGDEFQYVDFDNTLSKANPPMTRFFVRFSGKSSDLGDMITDIMKDKGLESEDPIVARGLTDIVFVKEEDDDD